MNVPAPVVFEEEVRRLARELWPRSGGEGPVIIGGRERDGVFITSDTIHILEATTDQRLAKAEKDIDKSIELKRDLSRLAEFESHNFKIWFITKGDPSPMQSQYASSSRKKARCPVLAMSSRTFQNHLVKAGDYLTARLSYPFGSVRNPDATSVDSGVPERDFVSLDMISQDDDVSWSADNFVKHIQFSNGIYLLLGDYGAGKSMTMRHVFNALRHSYLSGESAKFPVYINLRDHVGQDDPASALYDHATKIGFAQPDSLVRAWRAGFVHLFLDGFDEMVSSRFRGGSKGLRAARAKAMTLVRKFLTGHPAAVVPVCICGRENYFGHPDERRAALGLQSKPFKTLTLNEFTPEQVQRYLARLSLKNVGIPDWLPTRPLLIGYLARHQIVGRHSDLEQLSRAEGWDFLLDRICEREGEQIEALGGEAISAIRIFIDRLATKARQTSSGRGPISVRQITKIFEELVPATADDAVEQLLLRMAGLAATGQSSGPVVTSPPDQEDTREFIDEDFVDAARAGDVIRFINNSHDTSLSEMFGSPEADIAMGDLGVEVAVRRISENKISEGHTSAALQIAANVLGASALSFDILRIMQELEHNVVNASKLIVIQGIEIQKFEVTATSNLSQVVVRDCIIRNLVVDSALSAFHGPRFEGCLIANLEGRMSKADLPTGLIDDTSSIEAFDNEGAVSATIRQLQISAPERVLLIALRKLFQQAGSGRKDTAFQRGLGDDERPYVSEVMSLIKSYGFAQPQKFGGNTVWIPNRAKRSSALSILQTPKTTAEPLVSEVRKL